MGNILSSIFNKSYVHFEITENIVPHPLVGEFLVLRDEITGGLVFAVEVNLKELDIQDYGELERHQLFSHANILRFEGFKKLDDDTYLTLFESYEYTLEEEIQARQAQNKRFTENEILGLLQNISAALAYFQKKGIYHGQVTPGNIVKKGEDYKLMDPVLFDNYDTTYGKVLEGEDESLVRLLSPELLEAVERRETDPIHEEFKQDIYALGVIILDAIVLDNTMPLPHKFQMASDYSKSLVQVLDQMVEEDASVRIDAVSCSKVIENIYYGFPMTDDADPMSVPIDVENQVKSVLPGYYDLEMSPHKEEPSPLRSSLSNKKKRKTTFDKLINRINDGDITSHSVQPQEIDFSHYISLEHAKSDPDFHLQPQPLNQSYNDPLTSDDTYGRDNSIQQTKLTLHSPLEARNDDKILVNRGNSQLNSGDISYKYTATTISNDPVPSSFFSKDTSHNKTAGSYVKPHNNTEYGESQGAMETLSQEPKKEDISVTSHEDVHTSALKGLTETLGLVTKNAVSQFGDTYTSKFHSRQYSNPIEYSASKFNNDPYVPLSESPKRQQAQRVDSPTSHTIDFTSQITPNKNIYPVDPHMDSPNAQSYDIGRHEKSESNIFASQPKILVESYYLQADNSELSPGKLNATQQKETKYDNFIQNIISRSPSPDRASESIVSPHPKMPQEDIRHTERHAGLIKLNTIEINNDLTPSKGTEQTFRNRDNYGVPVVDTVQSIPISPNQDYDRIIAAHFANNTTPIHLMEAQTRTSKAEPTRKSFAEVLAETPHNVTTGPNPPLNDQYIPTESSQPLTYTASFVHQTEMSRNSPTSPKYADQAAPKNALAYQTFGRTPPILGYLPGSQPNTDRNSLHSDMKSIEETNGKQYDSHLHGESASHESPSASKVYEPAEYSTKQNSSYVPSFNSYRKQQRDSQKSEHNKDYRLSENKIQEDPLTERSHSSAYRAKLSQAANDENIQPGLLETYATNTHSAQQTNLGDYASNKTNELHSIIFATSPDNPKYRDYLGGSVEFGSKGLSEINVQDSYQPTEYVQHYTVDSLSPNTYDLKYTETDYKGYLSHDHHVDTSHAQQYQHSPARVIETDFQDNTLPVNINSASKAALLQKYSVGDLDDQYGSINSGVNFGSVDYEPHTLKEAEIVIKAMEWEKTKALLSKSRMQLKRSTIGDDEPFFDERFEKIEALINNVDRLSHKKVTYPPRNPDRDISKIRELAKKRESTSYSSSYSSKYNGHDSQYKASISVSDGITSNNLYGLYTSPSKDLLGQMNL